VVEVEVPEVAALCPSNDMVNDKEANKQKRKARRREIILASLREVSGCRGF
jgi:hypothetical protein